MIDIDKNKSRIRDGIIELLRELTILLTMREQYVSVRGKQQIDRLREMRSTFRSVSAEFVDDDD
jgi:hypothetical protein